jgi:hypothetical protein
MYTVATYRLSLAADLALLKAIPAVTIWAATGVWSLAMLGLTRRLISACRQVATGKIVGDTGNRRLGSEQPPDPVRWSKRP